MSSGPRIPLAEADAMMADLFQRFNLDSARHFAAGSVRRRCATVGDLEIVAPLPAGDVDTLFDRLAACIALEDGGLFQVENQIGVARQGLKPGFKAARIDLSHKVYGVVPLEIYRYTQGIDGNLGWSLIMRTGPEEFGKEFLRRWKKKWAIHRDQNACAENFLRDAHGQAIPTKDEREAFSQCGFGFVVPPEKREEYMRNLAKHAQ